MQIKTLTQYYILIFILIAIIVLAIFNATNKNIPPSSPTPTSPSQQQTDTLPGLQTSAAPWVPEIAHLRERLNILGLPVLATEGSALHTHQHLDIFIHGKTTLIPAGIGINEAENFISPIHVHETDAVIHIESPQVRDFTLGQFFDVWGVRFTGNCLGAYCVDAKNNLAVFVNGNNITTDPRAIVLQQHQEIAIAYGAAEEMPKTIPSSYTFAVGE